MTLRLPVGESERTFRLVTCSWSRIGGSGPAVCLRLTDGGWASAAVGAGRGGGRGPVRG